MAAVTASETWDAAWTLTLRKNRKRLTDNIFDEYPVLAALRKSGKVEIEDGGKVYHRRNPAVYMTTKKLVEQDHYTLTGC